MDRITCPTCGETHDLSDMQVGYDKPDAYFAVPEDECERRVTLDADVATIDGTHHFLRGVLEIPVRGEAQPFGWGIWVKVSLDDFSRYNSTTIWPARVRLTAFSGQVATQLAPYPQTLGLPVIVRPSDGNLRPVFDVVGESHALAQEQRNGIRVERVLEYLSRYLHAGLPERRGEPYVATLVLDGWQLEDASVRFQAHNPLHPLPAAQDRASLRPGDIAKLIFTIEASDEAGVAEVHRERMWVEVDHVSDDGSDVHYSGILANDPQVAGITRAGMRVWFRAEHIIDIRRAEANPNR